MGITNVVIVSGEQQRVMYFFISKKIIVKYNKMNRKNRKKVGLLSCLFLDCYIILHLKLYINSTSSKSYGLTKLKGKY